MIQLTKQYLTKVLKSKKRVFLFFDYDGTLSPIVRNPYLARISPLTKKSLKKLAANRRFVIGVISGRSLGDLKKRVGLKNIVYAGSHGLEMSFKGRQFVSGRLCRKQPRALPGLRLVNRQLKQSLRCIKGVIFEDKGLILAVHYRKVEAKNANRVKAIFNEITAPFLKAELFKIGSGKKVLELRPNIPFSKADSVKFFCKQFKKGRGDLVLFVGDDLTDENVFKILKSPDLSIRIGRSKSSKARYYLRNIQDFLNLLGYIARLDYRS